MSMDRKEVFAEAYYNALEDGLSEHQAEEMAREVMISRESALMDEAMNMLEEREMDICGKHSQQE